MCARDPLFYINTFGWTFNTDTTPSIIPFITYPRQDTLILTIRDSFGRDSICVPKTRRVGASWCCIAAIQHDWQFSFDPVTHLMASRKEEYVDKGNDPKTLFWKFLFLIRHQPGWLQPNYERTKLHIYNCDNSSTVNGESTNEDIGRGGGFRSILADEFASVEKGHEIRAAVSLASKCVIYNSTPKGQNAFYDVAHNDAIVRIDIHWTDIPPFARGLQYDSAGKPTSPWYRRECEVLQHEQLINQELNIDFLASDYVWFDAEMIELRLQSCRMPMYRGELEYDPLTGRDVSFTTKANGRLIVWCELDLDGRPPHDRPYVIGGDVSAGTGASNSALSVGDKREMEQVAEFASPHISPHELAVYCVALANFFEWVKRDSDVPEHIPGFVIWEANGPGQIFRNSLRDLGFNNIYIRRQEKKLSPKSLMEPGWWSTRDTKQVLMGALRKAWTQELLKTNSVECLKEAKRYIFSPEGGVEHSGSLRTLDPSGAKDNHGDRVIAQGVMWHGLRNYSWSPPRRPEFPRGSFGHRRQLWEQKRLQNTTYWPVTPPGTS